MDTLMVARLMVALLPHRATAGRPTGGTPCDKTVKRVRARSAGRYGFSPTVPNGVFLTLKLQEILYS